MSDFSVDRFSRAWQSPFRLTENKSPNYTVRIKVNYNNLIYKVFDPVMDKPARQQVSKGHSQVCFLSDSVFVLAAYETIRSVHEVVPVAVHWGTIIQHRHTAH